jgi:2-phospho-L-lactate guanylyltransferase
MKLWLLVPVKPLEEAKSRLAGVLAPGERTTLMRGLLARTLRLADESHLFVQRLVVSRDAEVWQTARQEGALALAEEGAELNQALAQGCRWAEQGGADAVMILPADLPLLRALDLEYWQDRRMVAPMPCSWGCRRACRLPLGRTAWIDTSGWQRQQG